MSPRVTVLLATYNWSSVLRYSIASVLRQTFTDFELLVVGDGCTDDSDRVVAEAGDARVRWINLPQNTKHQSGPNNEGLRQARGEIIAYLGHDDLWLPHHLQAALTVLDATQADIAYSLSLMVPPESEAGWLWVPRPKLRTFGPPASMVHRRSVTERIGPWRDYRELPRLLPPDRELWLRAMKAGLRFALVPRLTCVKFPAVWRRDAYRKRDCREQAAWSAKIAADPDFEAHHLAEFIAGDDPVPIGVGVAFRQFLRHVLARLRLSRASGFGLRPRSIEEARRFKGL